jgi:hypothetical protein
MTLQPRQADATRRRRWRRLVRGQFPYEARQHGLRNEPHQPPKLEKSGDDLKNTHENGGGEQVLNAVVADEAGHQDGGRRRRSRDRRGTPACEGDDARDHNGRIQANFRIDARDKRKTDGFGNESQGDDDSGQARRGLKELFTDEGGLGDHGRVGPQLTQKGSRRSGQRFHGSVLCVVRRIGGRKSHSDFHRVRLECLHIEAFYAARQRCGEGASSFEGMRPQDRGCGQG